MTTLRVDPARATCDTCGVSGRLLVIGMVGGALVLVLVFQALNQWT